MEKEQKVASKKPITPKPPKEAKVPKAPSAPKEKIDYIGILKGAKETITGLRLEERQSRTSIWYDEFRIGKLTDGVLHLTFPTKQRVQPKNTAEFVAMVNALLPAIAEKRKAAPSDGRLAALQKGREARAKNLAAAKAAKADAPPPAKKDKDPKPRPAAKVENEAPKAPKPAAPKPPAPKAPAKK